MPNISETSRDINLSGSLVPSLQYVNLEIVTPQEWSGDKLLDDGTRLIQRSEEPHVLPRRATCFVDTPDEEYSRYEESCRAMSGLIHAFLDPSLLPINDRMRISKGEELLDGVKKHYESSELRELARVCVAGIRAESDKIVAQELQGRAETLNSLISSAKLDFWLVARNIARESLHAAPLSSVAVDTSTRPPKLVPVVQDKVGNQGVFPCDANLIPFPLHTKQQ